MQPWAEEQFKAVREGLGPTGKGRNDLDPAIRDCVPHGFPRILNNPEPVEIIQIPGRVLTPTTAKRRLAKTCGCEYRW